MRETPAPTVIEAFITDHAPTHADHGGWVLDAGTLSCKCGQRLGTIELCDPPHLDGDADSSAFREVPLEEVVAVLAAHVYGEHGPFTGHPDARSVCTRAARDLLGRFVILPRGDK